MSEHAVHEEAMGWVKLALCREHFDALLKCQQGGEADCSLLRDAISRCREESEQAAWKQLQSNAMVQCPKQFKAYAACMGQVQPDGRGDVLAADRAQCKPLWMAMQSCAAAHVNRHVEAQNSRSDGRFVPPPMWTVGVTRRRRAAPGEGQPAGQPRPPGPA